MQHYIKKYFWVVGVLVVVFCSAFAAKAVNHFVEAKYLGESAEPARPKRQMPQKQRKPVATRSKDGDALAKRNMFCSECEPVEPVDVEPTGDVQDGDYVPLTSLPLRLVATNISTIEAYSFATIRNEDSERQGAYWLNSEIPEAGKVEAIEPRYVDFRNEKTKRLERIALLGKSEAPRKKETPTTPTRRNRSKRDDLLASIEEGIKKVDDTHYEVDRSLVDKLLANPMSVARGARIVPSIKNGKSNGFKLYAIRPSSIYAKLGLMNGDTIHAVNGFDLTTPDKALEVYTKVKESSNLSVSVTRRGKSVNLDYNIQ